MRDASPGDKLKIALFGDLSLEEAMDLSRDRQILELEYTVINVISKTITSRKSMDFYEDHKLIYENFLIKAYLCTMSIQWL
jgi:hypothetical protein